VPVRTSLFAVATASLMLGIASTGPGRVLQRQVRIRAHRQADEPFLVALAGPVIDALLDRMAGDGLSADPSDMGEPSEDMRREFWRLSRKSANPAAIMLSTGAIPWLHVT
jgi:hypothetical protein